jgi:hypothetical protein
MNKEWNGISSLMSLSVLFRRASDDGRGRFLILSLKGVADKERKIDRQTFFPNSFPENKKEYEVWDPSQDPQTVRKDPHCP